MLRDYRGKRIKAESIYVVVVNKDIRIHGFCEGRVWVMTEWKMIVVGWYRSIVEILIEERIVANCVVLILLCFDFLFSCSSHNINWVFYLFLTAAISRWDILVSITVFVELFREIKYMAIEVWVSDVQSVSLWLDVLNINNFTSKYSS